MLNMMDYNRNTFNHNVFPPFINRNMLSSIGNSDQSISNQSSSVSDQDLKMSHNYKMLHSNSFNPILQSNSLFSNSSENCSSSLNKQAGNKKMFSKNVENCGISSISSSSVSSNSHLSISPSEQNTDVNGNVNVQSFSSNVSSARYTDLYENGPQNDENDHNNSTSLSNYFGVNNAMNNASNTNESPTLRNTNSTNGANSNPESNGASSLQFNRFSSTNLNPSANLHFNDDRSIRLDDNHRSYSSANTVNNDNTNSSANNTSTDNTDENLTDPSKRDYHRTKSYSPHQIDNYSNGSIYNQQQMHSATHQNSDTHSSFNSMVRAAAVLTGYSSSAVSKETNNNNNNNSYANCFYPNSIVNNSTSSRSTVNNYSNMFSNTESTGFSSRDEKINSNLHQQSNVNQHIRDWDCQSSGFFGGLTDVNSGSHFNAHSFFNPVKNSYHEQSSFANYMLPAIGKIQPSPPLSNSNNGSAVLHSTMGNHPDQSNSPKSQTIDLNNQNGNLMCDTSVNGEVDYNPRELEAFAERFKQRRIKLGVTQADVGKALGNLKLAGVGSLSQSTICRFESLTLSHNNMVALKPILQAWLEEAEMEAAERLRGTEMYDSDEERKRKRTSITDSEKRSLEAFFGIQPRPSSEKIAQIAEKLNLKKNVVRVWFCNQRQKQKRMKFSTLGLLGHYSPAL